MATVLDYHYYQDCDTKTDHDSNTITDCVTTNLTLMKDDCSSIVSLDSVPSVDNISSNHHDHHSNSLKVNHYYHLIKSIVLAFSAKQNINLILDTTSKPIVRHNCNHLTNNDTTTIRNTNDNNNNNHDVTATINTNIGGQNNTTTHRIDTNEVGGSTGVDGQISSIHGLKVISMFWIIGGHSYSFAMQWLFFQNSQDIEYDSKIIISQIYANTNFSVDCFFFIR